MVWVTISVMLRSGITPSWTLHNMEYLGRPRLSFFHPKLNIFLIVPDISMLKQNSFFLQRKCKTNCCRWLPSEGKEGMLSGPILQGSLLPPWCSGKAQKYRLRKSPASENPWSGTTLWPFSSVICLSDEIKGQSRGLQGIGGFGQKSRFYSPAFLQYQQQILKGRGRTAWLMHSLEAAAIGGILDFITMG